MSLVGANPELGLFILRLAVGILFLAYGPAKLSQPKIIQQSSRAGTNTLIGLLETVGAVLLILGAYIHIGVLFLTISVLRNVYTKTEIKQISFTEQNGWGIDFILLAALLAILLNPVSSYSLF